MHVLQRTFRQRHDNVMLLPGEHYTAWEPAVRECWDTIHVDPHRHPGAPHSA